MLKKQNNEIIIADFKVSNRIFYCKETSSYRDKLMYRDLIFLPYRHSPI